MDPDPKVRLNSLQIEDMGDLVRSYFAAQGRPARVSGYDVTFDDGTHGGLANLAQVLAVTDREQWPDAIADHFAALDAAPDRPASWEEAAPMVRLRIFAAAQVPTGSGPMVWPINDDLAVGLMLDTSDSSVLVNETELTDWHIKADLSFDRALHNTLEMEPISEATQRHEDGTEVHSISGGAYTSAHLLVLERHLEDVPHGALVAVPDGRTILFHPILDFTAVNAINVLVAEAGRTFEAASDPISAGIFWWKAGDLVRLPATVEGGKVQFAPPQDFIEVLNEVVEATKRKKRLFRRD